MRVTKGKKIEYVRISVLEDAHQRMHLTVVMQAVTLPSLALERGEKVVCPADLLREM